MNEKQRDKRPFRRDTSEREITTKSGVRLKLGVVKTLWDEPPTIEEIERTNPFKIHLTINAETPWLTISLEHKDKLILAVEGKEPVEVRLSYLFQKSDSKQLSFFKRILEYGFCISENQNEERNYQNQINSKLASIITQHLIPISPHSKLIGYDRKKRCFVAHFQLKGLPIGVESKIEKLISRIESDADPSAYQVLQDIISYLCRKRLPPPQAMKRAIECLANYDHLAKHKTVRTQKPETIRSGAEWIPHESVEEEPLSNWDEEDL